VLVCSLGCDSRSAEKGKSLAFRCGCEPLLPAYARPLEECHFLLFPPLSRQLTPAAMAVSAISTRFLARPEGKAVGSLRDAKPALVQETCEERYTLLSLHEYTEGSPGLSHVPTNVLVFEGFHAAFGPTLLAFSNTCLAANLM
jgi:hypothetical protein